MLCGGAKVGWLVGVTCASQTEYLFWWCELRPLCVVAKAESAYRWASHLRSTVRKTRSPSV